MQLAGKTILLTGATGGLGRAIAQALAGKGASLVLSSRKAADLADLAASLPGDGHRHLVTDLAVAGAGAELIAAAGEIDGIVVNAGLGANGKVDGYTAEQIEILVRVNLEAPMQMARAAAPALRERGSGHIVFISSLAGKAATPRGALYGATKAGLRAFSLGLRGDLARDGVGVSVVCPGFIREAGMFANSGDPPPMNLGTSSPREVADAVVEAIAKNRIELDVAPIRQRVLANFAHRFPSVAARLTGRVS